MQNPEQMVSIGAVLDGVYKIISCVNRGAQGEIFQAVKVDSGKKVSLKFIHADFYDDFDTGALRLEHEYNALQALQGLPMFLSSQKFKKSPDYAYIVMEWLDEVLDGADFIASNTPISFETWLWLARQITSALHECHNRGIIHRDIKPPNILIGAKSTLKLIDFGIAQQERYVRITENDLNMGTIFYMPPEQITDGSYGIPGEMYALGVTLYEFICGRVPFYADTPGEIMQKKSNADFVPPSVINPDIPEWVDAVFSRLLTPEPADRIQGTRELFSFLSIEKVPDEEPIVTLNPCDGCGRPLWKELPFCTYCGKLYNLDFTSGGYGVIARQVQDPAHLFHQFNQLTDSSLPSWRKSLFKTNYPHILLYGVSKESATIISETLTQGSNFLSATSKPYRDMCQDMKVGLVQVCLGGAAAFSLVWGLLWRKQSTMFSGTTHFIFFLVTISFLIIYTLLPLAPASRLGKIKKQREWPALSRFRQKIKRLRARRLQQNASSLIRRVIMIFDKIDGLNVSASIKKELAHNLDQLTGAGLDRLENMDRASEMLRTYRKQGIDKKIAACDNALQSAVDPGIKKELIDKIGELTAARSKRNKIEQQHAENEIIFSHILSELNSIYIFIQKGKFEQIKTRLSDMRIRLSRRTEKARQADGD